MKPGLVYILTHKNHTTLYVGVTSQIVQRMKQRKEKRYPGSFTARYNLYKLLYYKALRSMTEVIARGK
ncbi:GIY-YIG nuclease family protein [Paucihalobacter sp.]|uniref:GIY-YIG nuclease family protein n=1 Tax=Paucihalobacter sp. TaxID=2850405 RepID=UPI002FE3AA06